MQLHVFSDASEEAYGAVAYMRYVYVDHTITTTIVAAKSHVAPLAAISIPRMELMGAVTGLQLAFSVANALQMSMEQVKFWCDSMNTLWWIREHSRSFKPFVANRVGEIQNVTNPEQWRYVPTKDNAADHLTRGITASTLTCNDQWWKGPQFLQMTEDEWPENRIEMSNDAVAEQRKSRLSKREEKQSLFTDVVSSKKSMLDNSVKKKSHSICKENSWYLNPFRFFKLASTYKTCSMGFSLLRKLSYCKRKAKLWRTESRRNQRCRNSYHQRSAARCIRK